MANANPPYIEDIGGFDTYRSIDADDAALYDSFTDDRTRNAFISFMRKILRNRGKDLRRGSRGTKVVKLWSGRRKHWLSKPDTGRQPAATAVPSGAAPPVAPAPAPLAPAPAPPATAPVVPIATPPVLPQTNGSDTSSTPSESLGGDRSPHFVPQNDPDNKQFLAPTVGQREDFYNHENGHWLFATTLYQIELADGKRRFSKGSRPRKSVFLCVQTSSTGVIEDRIAVKCLEAIGEVEKINPVHEIHMNEMISTLHCSHLIPYRGHNYRKSTRNIRNGTGDHVLEAHLYNIYTSFAELGTLERIYRGHKDSLKPVPEHFIWYFLSQATEALLALQDGICSSPNRAPINRDDNASLGSRKDPRSNLAPTTWSSLVHSDIKDLNIFLRTNNPEYPAYPTVLVSDFDIAFGEGNPRQADDRRYQGTLGMQPPEREYRRKEDMNWGPAYWDISEKSDIWSLAMTAWALMVAHEDKDFYGEAVARCKKWKDLDALRNGNIGLAESIFPHSLDELPEEYSVSLCQLISDRLRYNPEHRPSLQIMRESVGRHLTKLDRMYGDEIGKAKDTIADEFKLDFETGDSNDWALYAPGQTFEPPRKRRKTENAGAFEDEWNDVTEEWEYTVRLPTSREADRDALDSIDDIINNLPRVEIAEFRNSSPHLNAWRYLFTSIRQRTYPEATVYRHGLGGNGKGDPRETFKHETKRTVLNMLLDTVMPIAINFAKDAAEGAAEEDVENAEDVSEITSLETLQHAIKLGLVLLDIGAEPKRPRLSGKTGMHRGVIDFLFRQPSGVYERY